MKRRRKKSIFPDSELKHISLLPILDNFYEGVTITDAEGVILYLNDRQAKIDDLDSGYAIGRKVTELYRVDEGISPSMTCLRTGLPIEGLACYYRTRLGKVVNSIHNVYPLKSNDKIIGAVIFITDYKTIEQTFSDLGMFHKSRELPTFGVAPLAEAARSKKNGTRFTFADLIGEDPDFLLAVRATRMASESPSPIMLFGETGTGKELFAQSIHNQSPRSRRPYVAINCAAIPENLLEGILFGTAKGAFTGAIDRPGLFETANGGTIFLDEVNSMTTGLQAKLLRILQERKVRRVGSLKEIPVDVKVVSSVNMEPHRAIETGALRPDLYYRLGVVFIRIPPLRERVWDLPRLVDHFFLKHNKILRKQVKGISADVMDLFRAYQWPGNVRELEHVIEGAMNMIQQADFIERRHLTVQLRTPLLSGEGDSGRRTAAAETAGDAAIARLEVPNGMAAQPSSASDSRCLLGKRLGDLRADSEIECIKAALADSAGNASEAARSLGISPQLMHYKLKRYGIALSFFKS